jgi:hypothetical protein
VHEKPDKTDKEIALCQLPGRIEEQAPATVDCAGEDRILGGAKLNDIGEC